MKRREAREIAFALLFEWSFKEDPPDELIETAVGARDLEVNRFARELLEKSVEECSRMDALIERYSEKWKINRLSRVTLSALRLSLCELAFFDDIPVGATINEAVELVKKFGTEDDAAFVNGVLGSYARKEKGGLEAVEEAEAGEEDPSPESGEQTEEKAREGEEGDGAV